MDDLPPLERAGDDRGWFADTVDAAETDLCGVARGLSVRLDRAKRPARTALRAIVARRGLGEVRSKTATRNGRPTTFLVLHRDASSDEPHGVARARDAFHTPPDLAATCVRLLKEHLGPLRARLTYFVEPSAGGGAFYRLLPGDRRAACELDDMASDLSRLPGRVVEGNFLRTTARSFGADGLPPDSVCVVGNPPFGRRDALAQRFLSHAAGMAGTVALVLPSSFLRPSGRPWHAGNVDRRLHFVAAQPLPWTAFCVGDGERTLNCAFVVYRVDAHRPRQGPALDPAWYARFTHRLDGLPVRLMDSPEESTLALVTGGAEDAVGRLYDLRKKADRRQARSQHAKRDVLWLEWRDDEDRRADVLKALKTAGERMARDCWMYTCSFYPKFPDRAAMQYVAQAWSERGRE